MKAIIHAMSVLLFAVCTVCYFYFAAQHRQAQRELIYKKAIQKIDQIHKDRQKKYEKRRSEEQKRREYNQGKVVGEVSLTVQP